MTNLAVKGLSNANETALFNRLENMALEISGFSDASSKVIDLGDGHFYFYVDVSKVLVAVGYLTRCLGESWNVNEHCRFHQFELMRMVDTAEQYLRTLQLIYPD